MIDFDEIWLKCSKVSGLELSCFSFHVCLLFCQVQTGHWKEREFWRCIKQMGQLWWGAIF